jgi:glycosyltransferase involved in cell wall biosynthesis
LTIVHGLFPQAAAGVELFALEAARSLGLAVFSLTPRGENAREWSGIRVVTPAGSEPPLRALHRALDELKPCAVLIQHLGMLGPQALFILRERQIPYAVFLHDFAPLCPTNHLWHRSGTRCSGPGALKCALCVAGTPRRAIEVPIRIARYLHRPQQWQQALAGADALFANSRFARDFWIDQGAPPERIAVVHPHIPASAATPVRPAARRGRELLYTGGWSAAKGAPFLCAALNEVEGSIHVHAAGVIAAESRAAFRTALHSRHQITFHGSLAPEGLNALLRQCSAVAIPSQLGETYSRTLGEALLAGVPPAATAVGGIPERVVHGLNGLLSAPDDAGAFAAALEEAMEGETESKLAQMHELAALRSSFNRFAAAVSALASGDRGPLASSVWMPMQRQLEAAWPEEASAARQLLTETLRHPEVSPAGPVLAAELFRVAETRGRRLRLNHALAYFHAASVAHVLDVNSGVGDAARWFSSWGMKVSPLEADPRLRAIAEANALAAPAEHAGADRAGFPDAAFINLRESGESAGDVRRRFPSLRIIATETEEGVELEGAGG